MRTQNYANQGERTMASKRNIPRTRAPWITIGVIIGLCCIAGFVAAAGYYLLSTSGGGLPLVLIHEPQNGSQLEAGEPTMVRAVASDERKIVRVEFWVDDQLQQAETSNVQGGISSFPLLTNWQPATAGVHTISVRAFNSLGVRAHSTINVNVIETADRDNDGVADANDICPDQAGIPFSNGCPDRDQDGTPDSADACPDTAGIPEASGCPSIVEGDRDGDGTPDESDVCPDAPGSPLTEGCPDSDGDLTADLDDSCVGEPGSPGSDGCPTPGDSDGDGLTDDMDGCPTEWGPPELGGCPEVVAPEGGGAPGGSGTDSDGDGSPDDTDPCPEEAGLEENDFCPPPDPGGSDEGLSLVWPFFGYYVAFPSHVEFEALNFEVNHHYHEIYCYARLAGGDMDRYEFEPADGFRQWNIDEVLGGANSVDLSINPGDPLEVFAECFGRRHHGSEPTYLGSILNQHLAEEWDGRVIEDESEGGEPDHSFRVRYHLCSPSCEETAIQAPEITRYRSIGDSFQLGWDWEGDPATIQGFKLYLNGNYVREIADSGESNVVWHLDDSALCVDEWDFTITAYAGPDSRHADIESSQSNSIAWYRPPCDQQIRVTFETLNLHHPPFDESGWHTVGPIAGQCAAATGGTLEDVEFDAAHCWDHSFLPIEYCEGFRLTGEHSVQGILDWVHEEIDACPAWGDCIADNYSASDTDTITVQVNSGDDLTLRCYIADYDLDEHVDELFNEQISVNTDELSPDSTLTLTIPGDYLDVIAKVDLFPFGE